MNKYREIKKINTAIEENITVIQVTDMHIHEVPPGTVVKFDSISESNTEASLKNVLAHINEHEKNIDIILLTGDLVHKPTETAYLKLANNLTGLESPIFCLPGNHDNAEMMAYVMGSNGVDSNKLIHLGNWAIILLDTNGDNKDNHKHGGYLDKNELNFLKDSLEQNQDRHCLIAIHHHPVPINSIWMDGMSLCNSDDFFEVVDQFERVRAIIWGHIHQEFEQIRKNVKLFGTPSTCLQFKPGAEAFALDDKTPGYRKIHLMENGEIKSKVVYLQR